MVEDFNQLRGGNINILFIGAHPDDIEIGCLGTILEMKNKNINISCLVLSNGEMSGNSTDRIDEVKLIKNKINYNNLFFGNIKDTSIKHEKKTVNIIEKIVKDIKPDFIFTHTHLDSHQDHINTSLSTISALRNKKNLIFYSGPSTLQNYHPNLFIDISKVIDKKIKLLKLFKSQIIKNSINLEAINAGTRYYGFLNDTNHCEFFHIFKMKIHF